MSKRFLAIMAVGVAVFIGLLLVNGNDSTTTENNSETAATNHVYGQVSTGVSVVEYGDFQCPACSQYWPIFTQLKQEYQDRVQFQFRHFPLIQIHQNAMAAHRAAEAAANQTKFWEMHDLLYQNQAAWETSPNPLQIFEQYAAQLQLNIEKFKADAASTEVNSRIQADLKAGQALGVSGTPTFVVNGQKIETPESYENFKKVIDEAIAAQQ